MSKNNGMALAAAFLGGALVGAAAGLLFAPVKGEEQRRRIKIALERAGVHVKNSEELNKLVDKIRDAIGMDGGSDIDVEEEEDKA